MITFAWIDEVEDTKVSNSNGYKLTKEFWQQ